MADGRMGDIRKLKVAALLKIKHLTESILEQDCFSNAHIDVILSFRRNLASCSCVEIRILKRIGKRKWEDQSQCDWLIH